MSDDTRIPTSLARHVGEAPRTDAELRAMAAAAWRSGRGVWFAADQLKAMPAMMRAVIEAEARKLYGRRGP